MAKILYPDPNQSGVATLSFSAIWWKTAAITFDTPFSGVPRLRLTVYQTGATSGNWTVYAHGVSASGMTIRVDDIQQTNRTATVYVAWEAWE